MPFACNTHQCLGVGVLNKEIEHMVLLALKSREIYDDVTRGQDASLTQINPIPFFLKGLQVLLAQHSKSILHLLN
jgi:hypothetical protein